MVGGPAHNNQIATLRCGASESEQDMTSFDYTDDSETIVLNEQTVIGDVAIASGDTINALNGNDFIIVSDVMLIVNGGDGNDTFISYTGGNTLSGGAGNDTYYVNSTPADAIVELADGGTDTIYTSSLTYSLADTPNIENLSGDGESGGDFNLTGNSGDNIINASSGNDTLDGGDGNDTLNGQFGVDQMTGGAGNDTYIIDNSEDTATEVANGGTDTIITSLSIFSLAGKPNIENLTGDEYNDTTYNLTGNGGDNIITASYGNDTLDGGDGNDTLDGKGGIDTMTGGAGNDTYMVDVSFFGPGGPAFDTVVELADGGIDTVNLDTPFDYTAPAFIEIVMSKSISEGDSKVTGNSLDNTLVSIDFGYKDYYGLSGNDTYKLLQGDEAFENANEGTDTVETMERRFILGDNIENLTGTNDQAVQSLQGNALANRMSAATAGSTMTGLGGNDTYVVKSGDTVSEAVGEGIDTVETALASYTLGSNVENLMGTSNSPQTLIGNAANNVIIGGAADNVIIGGAGRDFMTGGAGKDVFDLNSIAESKSTTRDWIADFKRGADHINLRDIDANSKISGNQTFTFIGESRFTMKAGQLNIWQSDTSGTANDYTLVKADANGDGKMDFAINVKGLVDFTASDFIL
jgi:Ca2+-binding RTX toxin-like protein